MHIRLFLFVTILLYNISAVAQKNTDGKFIFKTWFFLEHINASSRGAIKFPEKNSNIFRLFDEQIDLEIDTLKCSGFPKEFVCLAIKFDRKQILETFEGAIIYSSTTPYLEYMSIPVNCEAYILCINKKLGTSYRLKGFYGNDFFNLFKELNDIEFGNNKKELAMKKFLDSYFIEGIDFTCIYDSYLSGKYGPCMTSCANFTIKL